VALLQMDATCLSKLYFCSIHLYKGIGFPAYLLLHKAPLLSRTGGGFFLCLHVLPETPCQFPTEPPNRSLSRVNTVRRD